MKTFKSYLQEAIPLSTYREEVYKQISKKYKERYKDWFGGKWRLYFPLDDAVMDGTYSLVNSVLAHKDYEIYDWKKGLAKSKTSDKVQRIGKIISSLGTHDDVLKKFNERFKGKVAAEGEEFLIVISRHPYDIAGQSFDREWYSCKHLETGMNGHYVVPEIEEGAIVAYVTTPDDKNLKKPIARKLMVPLVNEDDEDDVKLFLIPSMYGKHVDGFEEFVEEWLESKQGYFDVSEYCVDSDKIYDGDFQGEVRRKDSFQRLRAVMESSGDWDVMRQSKTMLVARTTDIDIVAPMFFNYSVRSKHPDLISGIFSGRLANDFRIQYTLPTFKWHRLADQMVENKELSDLVYKKYTDAGGTEQQDSDEYFEDIVAVLEDFCNDWMEWHDTTETERYYEEFKIQIHRALDKTGIFELSLSGDMLYMECTADDADIVSSWLEDSHDFANYFDEYHTVMQDTSEEIEPTIEEIIEWVEEH